MILLCRSCGGELISPNSKKSGHCSVCVTDHKKDAIDAWKKIGVKFCSKCDTMIHSKTSLVTGVCMLCRHESKSGY